MSKKALNQNLLKFLTQPYAKEQGTFFCRNVSSNSLYPEDPATHTGQTWKANDPRMVRYTNAPKKVNPNWSMKLVQEIPPIVVKERVVSCEGGPSKSLGHPKVYINLDIPGTHACIYCQNRFVKEDSH